MRHGSQKPERNTLERHHRVLETPMWSVSTPCYGMWRLEATQGPTCHTGGVYRVSEGPVLKLDNFLLQLIGHMRSPHPTIRTRDATASTPSSRSLDAVHFGSSLAAHRGLPWADRGARTRRNEKGQEEPARHMPGFSGRTARPGRAARSCSAREVDEVWLCVRVYLLACSL